MPALRLRGMTWDHPRGYDPLVACSAHYREMMGVEIEWDKRSLQDFESYPVEELARRYDLIVIDHPHIGQVVRENCLAPFDRPAHETMRRALLSGSVGLSYHSYVYRGRLWALPLDAATQVQAWRPDKLPRAPESWAEVLELADAGAVILPLLPPHSLMCVMTLAANLGWQAESSSEEFLPRELGAFVVDQLGRLVARLDPHCLSADPIAALSALASGPDLACCPLVYGYVSYSRAGFSPHRLAFGDIPGLGSAGPLGSVLGGTGLAVSAHSDHPHEAMAFAYWVTSAEIQSGIYSAAGGQPAHSAAWLDPSTDAAANGFFSQTRATLEGAMVRPRHDGYMLFQQMASERLTQGFRDGVGPAEIVAEINALMKAATTPRHGEQRSGVTATGASSGCGSAS